jgi:hypothetical protein
MEVGAAANAIVAKAGGVDVGKVSAEVSARGGAEAGAADITEAGPADMTEGSRANVAAAKMHAAEMTAATEVATAAAVPAAATAAGKGIGREAQRAKGDARQEHSCCLGHHDFLSWHRTARGRADRGRARSFTGIYAGAGRRLQSDCRA